MEINRKALAGALSEVLEEYHFNSSNRYRSICFMTRDIQLAETIKNTFYLELSSYELWLEPELGTSPAYGISRGKFERAILSDLLKGLLIYRPEDWISSWPKPEQAAFWSFISMLHGRREIVLITTLSASSDINHYMKESLIGGTGISYWLSNKV